MAIGDPKTGTAMKKELAALQKKRDAGNITAFQFRKQSNAIKKKYGEKPTPSNVSKIFNYISTKTPMDAIRDSGALKASPNSAKAKAAAKAAKNKAGLANRGRSQGGQKAGEAKKYASDKKKDVFKGLDLRKDSPKNNTSKKSSGKTWKDFKSVSAAQKAGLNYFTGSDGKKKIAITAEQLKKKGMSLRKYANSLKGKK